LFALLGDTERVWRFVYPAQSDNQTVGLV